jgi:hypothetical protein
MSQLEKRWSRAPKTEAPALLCDTLDRLARNQAGRLSKARRRLGVYLARTGANEPRLSAETYDEGEEVASEPLKLSQSVVDTGKAKIAARQRPKGQVLTKGGSYEHRLQARELSKFCEGILYQQQGNYENTWELMEQAFKDCEIWEAGIICVVPDYQACKIRHERGFAHEFFADPLESHRGSPRHLHRRYPASKYYLVEMVSGTKAANGIMAAALHADDKEGASVAEREHDMCSVYEGWFLGYGGKPGRHIIAVRGAATGAGAGGVTVIVDEEWDWPCFPIASIMWERNQFGMWGTPLVDQNGALQANTNDVYGRMGRNVRSLARGYLEYDESAYDDNQLKKMVGNELSAIKRKSGAPQSQFVMPNPFNPATMQYFQESRSMCFEIPGVSEMGAQGKRSPGLDSGIAIRSENDLQSERFLPKSTSYENLAVQLARLDMYAANDIKAKGGKLKAARGYGEYLDELIWDDIAPGDMEQFTVQAASSMEDTLAGRRQFISDYAKAGYITPDVAERMLATPNPDVEAMNKREQAQYRYLERVTSKFQRAKPKEWDPQVDTIVPDELLFAPTAYTQMVDAYIEMLGDEAPEFNLRLMRDYISLLNALIQRSAPKAPPAPPMGGGGGGAMAPELMAPPDPMGAPMPQEIAA